MLYPFEGKTKHFALRSRRSRRWNSLFPFAAFAFFARHFQKYIAQNYSGLAIATNRKFLTLCDSWVTLLGDGKVRNNQ
jgi:hypothetical protein